MPEAEVPVGAGYKGQPWVLYDTVAAFSFLVGDTSPEGLAIGTQLPAITSQGKMIFFSAGRTRAGNDTLTNMDIDAQLSYGMSVWQIYVRTIMPIQNIAVDIQDGVDNNVFPQILKLTENILNLSVLNVDLGQEEQLFLPVLSVGAGGGQVLEGNQFVGNSANGVQVRQNMLNLPEPIEMPRTQNMKVELILDPRVLASIGTVAAPGNGIQLPTYSYLAGPDPNNPVAIGPLLETPFSVQVGLVGRRVKKTQYGMIPGAGN